MNRYEPRIYQTLSGDFSAVMKRHYNGTYITYESHKQEIESLQSRLKALESKKKDSISISSIIAGHVEDALRKSIGEAVHQVVSDIIKGGLNKYNGDPCHSTVDAFVNELAAGPGKTVVDDGAKFDYLTKDAKFTFGSNFGEGKALTMSTAKMEPRSGGYGYSNRHVWAVGECESARDRKVAVCYYVGGNGFVNGGEYEYEEGECETGSKPRVIHITQDDFASGLKGDYRWRAVKVGNVINANGELVDAYATLNINGGVVAQFYIK